MYLKSYNYYTDKTCSYLKKYIQKEKATNVINSDLKVF